MTDTVHGEALGYERVGSGPLPVIVLNDWLCDTSTWDGARAYLDTDRFSWAFADLRGYGRSRDRRGEHTVREGAADVLALADALGWRRFVVVGHSMSCLVALHLAQHHAERIERVVVLTPPPPAGFGADEATLGAMQALARADLAQRAAGLRTIFGERLSERWRQFKAARWRAAANPDAVAAYVAMFAQQGLPDLTTRVGIPVLAVTGEQDGPPLRSAAITPLLSSLCEQLEVTPIADSGHYPMQETPPLLVTIVERFLAGTASA